MENKNKLPEFLQTAETTLASFDEIVQSINAMQGMADDGMESEIKLYLQLQTIQKLAEKAKKNISKITLEELKNCDGAYQIGNQMISSQDGKVTYSFASNPNYKKKKDEIKEIETNMKTVAKLFDGTTNPFQVEDDGTIINLSTGEVVFMAESKISAPIIKITTIKEKK